MGQPIDKNCITDCLRRIEDEFNHGSSATWSNYDFEKLSAAIEEKAHVSLSITTLKRIWGRVNYPHSPTVTTLNALAQFLSFSDWRAFENDCQDKTVSEEIGPFKAIDHPERKIQWKAITLAAAFGIVIIAIASILIASQKMRQFPKPDNSMFKFSADKVVSEGLPNSVLFTYDATGARSDSVFIIQTWDLSRKTLVSKAKHDHSAIYYYPGYYRAKLMADGHIVKAHDLQINSNGWLCLAENLPAPLYFKKEECVDSNLVEVNKEVLKKYNLSLQPTPPKLRFFYEQDMGNLMDDNFTFETNLKNEFADGSNACQFVQVLIQCKDDVIIIPLSAKSCVGDLHLYAAGKEVNSQEANLSGFGCDLQQWTKLKVVTKDKYMRFFVNKDEVYSLNFPNEAAGIVGVQFRFNGTGAVKDTKFYDAYKTYDLK